MGSRSLTAEPISKEKEMGCTRQLTPLLHSSNEGCPDAIPNSPMNDNFERERKKKVKKMENFLISKAVTTVFSSHIDMEVKFERVEIFVQ